MNVSEINFYKYYEFEPMIFFIGMEYSKLLICENRQVVLQIVFVQFQLATM